MLLYRVLSALVGIPVFLFLVWYGGLPLLIFTIILVSLGILEINRLWDNMGIKLWLPGALASGALFTASAYFVNGARFGSVQLDGGFVLGFVIFLVLTINIFYLVKSYPAFTFTDFGANFFSSVYVGWLISHIYLLRELPSGFHYVLLVLAATWSTDTFAYFVGMNFGRHRLAPVLSPKKSIEGAVGGVAGSIIASVLVGYLSQHLPIINYVVVGLLAGTIGQVGDLAESALKRLAGVKDSGNIIPGHGGILDRFDSLLLTAPAVYYFLRVTM
ncbi:MAG TPA: phosphatidate cytidylyltransferase [Desulfobacteria bacterium]|nr:phosphatidate cytidylyltransferase [Desulfobacteria bacterium]